jgi:polysaccharide chain length determinant protein (PEP-CTERM system associated)
LPDDEQTLGQTLQYLLQLIIRRRWWIMLPAAIVTLAVVGVALVLPDRYESEATLNLVQQQIPQNVVASVTTMTIADAVNATAGEILSRDRLLAIIQEFDLYPKERKNSTPQALAEQMRKDLDIKPENPSNGGFTSNSGFTTFKISFIANNPQLAQRVVGRLTSLFIEENLKNRGNQVARTADFLSEQLGATKQKLDQQEQRLADFKKNNRGELPEEQASNIGTLTDLRSQLTTVLANQRRAQDQRASLESSISGNVARLESEKAALLNRLTPRHPDVLKKDQEIVRMKGLLEGASSPEDSWAVQMKNQLDANAREVESLAIEGQRLRAEILQYQQRVNLTPLREQQLTGLLRDYDLVKQDYADLVNKQLRSQQSASLEERQEGQNFRLVDPPTLPVLPTSPKRIKIALGGAAGGSALGLALAFLMNFTDRSFHSDKDLQKHCSIPLVVTLPVLLTPAEGRGRNWKRAFEWLGATAMLLIVSAAEFYIFRHG